MSKNFSISAFFRAMPNHLLKRYFEHQSVTLPPGHEQWHGTKPTEWLAFWGTLEPHQKTHFEADFREIYALSDEAGFKAMLDELEWQYQHHPEQKQEVIEALRQLESHYERVITAFLDHPICWKGANRFSHADSLGHWRKRRNIPNRPAAVDDASIKALSDCITAYFLQVEGRGKHCLVECYRRGEQDYFFAYPEDYSIKDVEWQNGELGTRPHNPAFEIVFVYEQAKGRLDIHCKGGYKAIEPLQKLFAQTILKLDDLPSDLNDDRVYELNQLTNKTFEFITEPTSGIGAVWIKKLRLSSTSIKGQRITLEASSDPNKPSIYDLIDTFAQSFGMDGYRVTMVELAAVIQGSNDLRTRSKTVRITYPNSCSLKYDETDLKLRAMLQASGLEPVEQVEVSHV